MKEWTEKFAEVIVASLKEVREELEDEQIAMFAVDCHPWDGFLGLAILTQEEVDEDPPLLDPEEMAAWEFYDFASDLELWESSAEAIESSMEQAYQEAKDPEEVAMRYFRACTEALGSTQVQEALSAFTLAPSFRLSVINPDTGEEFYSVS